jgi:predicted Zn finger-like uncharacterized protein
MIVQCDQCNAKFRLDDSKIKESGVKVRCSKCKNIFVVHKESPAEDADFDSFLSGLTTSSSGSAGDSGLYTAPDALIDKQVSAGAAPASTADVPIKEQPVTASQLPSQEDFDLSEFAFDQQGAHADIPSHSQQEPGRVPDEDFVFGELELDGGKSTKRVQEPGGAAGSSPHEEFEFKAEPVAQSIPEFELDIDDFDVFGESDGVGGAGTSALQVLKKEGYSPPDPKQFSLPPEVSGGKAPESEGDFFTDSTAGFSLEPETVEDKSDSAPAAVIKKIEQPSPFDFGDFEFGESPVKEKETSGSQKDESWFVADQASSSEFSRISAPEIPDMPVFDDEAPPLSISSRRRGGSGLPIAVTAVSVLLVLVLAGGGFYLFKEGPAAFNKVGLGFMAKWLGVENRDAGGVAIRNTTGIFLNNKEAGEIFAINGEAINNFGKPRASIQVKATLFGPKGEVLQQKTAYCGNVISREQLTVLPAAKLEAAMNNQFGDSLSNLAVQPGKGIHFVIVLVNVPKEVAEFGVEITGSTVASQ